MDNDYQTMEPYIEEEPIEIEYRCINCEVILDQKTRTIYQVCRECMIKIEAKEVNNE